MSNRLDDLLPTDHPPILLFDGTCNLCTSLVQFIVDRDSEAIFRFASLQSSIGQAILTAKGLQNNEFDTAVLVEDGNLYIKSTAVLRACRHLDGHYPLLRVLCLVPRPIRDQIYTAVADNRYDWFGKTDECRLPTPELRARFLDDGVDFDD